MILNGKILGCYTVIPQEFVFFSKKFIFGQWCENLIHKDFRGSFMNFKKMGNIVNEELKKYFSDFFFLQKTNDFHVPRPGVYRHQFPFL